MRSLHRHIWITVWVLHFLVKVATEYDTDTGEWVDGRYLGINYFFLGVLFVSGLLYVVDAKTLPSIFMLGGALGGLCVGIGLIDWNTGTAYDLHLANNSAWLLERTLFGGMVGLGVLDIYRWLRKKWRNVGEEDIPNEYEEAEQMRQ